MTELAIIKTGGKQYKVSPGKKLKIEKLATPTGDEPSFAGEAGHRREVEENQSVVFDNVLLISNGDKVEIGKPLVKSAKVEGKVLKQGRHDKKIVFKYHRKTRYHKKKGHRQPFTEVEITKITG